MRVSSPGIYSSMRGLAELGIRVYFEISDLFLGTRVKTLPESKSRSFRCINLRIAGSSFSFTA